MDHLISSFDPNYVVYAGATGILLGLLFLLFFLYRRIRWLLGLFSRKRADSPGLLASLRNLVLIVVWVSVFGMLLFMGFFFRAYHAFTAEQPVAEILAEPLGTPKTSRVWICPVVASKQGKTRQFTIRGDQWMIEGDILKWEDWLKFLGLGTRYRLTRIRGRYVTTSAEIQEKQTVHSLVEDEDHPLWRYLYKYGHRFPFVSTVYGNAAFQNADQGRRYLLSVGSSGFVVREIGE